MHVHGEGISTENSEARPHPRTAHLCPWLGALVLGIANAAAEVSVFDALLMIAGFTGA